jgi:phosphoglycolate phosphatase-like HAD superfamily hydrolase
MIRLVLFDIDATLIHTNHVGITAFGKTLETVFGIADGTSGLTFAGRTDTGMVRELFLKFGVDPVKANFEKFFDAYTHFLGSMLPHCKGKICPGVSALIGELKALENPPALGLLTGNIRRGAELKLGHFGLWEQFQTGAFADDSEKRNEIAAAVLERGRRLLGDDLAGGHAVVIGDTPHDVACGHSIGAKVLAVATGDSTVEELAALNPEWAVKDLTKITAAKLCGVC